MSPLPAIPLAAPPADKRDALREVLRAWGHDVDDFDIQEQTDADLGMLFGLHGGVLTVRRRSRGIQRVYATGVGSAWFAGVLIDLSRGLLGPPAFPVPPPAPPRSMR